MADYWNRVEQLFHEALELPERDRDSFLSCECAGDDAVRCEVKLLLAADESRYQPPRFATPVPGSGEQIQHYQILSVLGEGGSGTVYLARDSRTGTKVAIKIFNRFQSPVERRRYLQEARALSALQHPNIVRIYEVGSAPTGDYLVMEHIEGRTVAEMIPHGGLPLQTALRLGRMMAEGMAAAHAAGIVHRDLKPANLMVDSTGVLKILDFGLAKLIETGPEPTLRTVTGQIVGTACYLSPEQAEGKTVNTASDVFSCGAVLYEMFTGEKVFDRGSLAGTLSAVLRDQPAPVRKLRPEVPKDSARIVERCLDKDPARRYISGKELKQALAAYEAKVLATESSRWRQATSNPAFRIAAATVFAFGIAALAWWGIHLQRVRHARQAAQQIPGLVADHRYNAADELVRQIETLIPEDQQVREFQRDYRLRLSIVTDPPGAEVAIKDYGTPDAPWRVLGKGPLNQFVIPWGFLRWRVSAPGYITREFAENGILKGTLSFKLYKNGPAGMVLIPKGDTYTAPPVNVPEFWLDQYEVTNRQYQEFVNSGGYRRRELWKYPFVRDNKSLTWEEAMGVFVDQTNRPGPAGWQLGVYPENEAEFPVTGVSWYEAAAYAVFAGKELPVYRQWQRSARSEHFYADVALMSNLGGKGLAAVGSFRALDRFGTYDLAGNCQEWIWNEGHPGQRLAVGGAWNQAHYGAAEFDSFPPITRRPEIGFRCARNVAPLPPDFLDTPSFRPERDFYKETLVSDAEFAKFRKLYDDSPEPLSPLLEQTDESNPYWRKLKVSFAAAYGNERVPAYLFLPRKASPPYQAIVYYPTSIARVERDSSHLEMWYLDPLIRTGRAVLYPVLFGTYERQTKAKSRDRDIRQVRDLRRAVDYLQSRPDMDSNRIGYFGFSYGVVQAPVVLAMEPRFKAAILAVGGFSMTKREPEVEAVQFAPHAHTPVLMMCGRYDSGFQVETSVRPMLDLFGAPRSDKKLLLIEAGHAMMGFPATTRESIAWLDRYLGPVK